MEGFSVGALEGFGVGADANAVGALEGFSSTVRSGALEGFGVGADADAVSTGAISSTAAISSTGASGLLGGADDRIGCASLSVSSATYLRRSSGDDDRVLPCGTG